MIMPTLKIPLTTAWQRIDNSSPTVTFTVTSMSSVKAIYQDGTTTPAPGETNFETYATGDRPRYDMKTGDSLWVAALPFSTSADAATITVTRRVP